MFFNAINLAPIPETYRILEKMGASSITFYPTGSRFIGGSSSKSDWDFYISAMDKEEFLREFPKFKPISHTIELDRYCGDPTILDIYGYASIQVQIIGNLHMERKALVNNWLRDKYPILLTLGFNEKSIRNNIWRKLMNTNVPIK